MTKTEQQKFKISVLQGEKLLLLHYWYNKNIILKFWMLTSVTLTTQKRSPCQYVVWYP